MAFTHDIDMRIVPGKSLGDFSLGDSLWNVLERMRARKLESGIRRDDGAVGSGSECFSSSSAGLGLMCCAKDPTSPVIVDVPPGIKLVFPYTPAPHQQILQIITVHLRHNDVRPSQPSRLQTLNISYENKHLATIGSQHESKTPLTRGKISQIFGPAFTRRPGTPSAKPSADRSSPSREPDIRYPGIVFSTDQLHGDVIGDVAVVAAGQEESAEMRRFVDQLRGATTEQGWPTLEWIDRQALVGTITLCEIIPHQGIILHIANGKSGDESTCPYRINLGETTEQDLLCDLGPPARRYWKEEDRFISNDAGSQADPSRQRHGGEFKGCWWNYFGLGLDFLVEEQGMGRIMKIMVHSNIPGTAEFQRHARCPWLIRTTSSKCSAELSLASPLEDFAAVSGKSDRPHRAEEVAGVPKPRSNLSRKQGGSAMQTVLLDRLEEASMAGLQGIEPSHLMALDGLIVEGGQAGVTSVLLFSH